MNYLRNQVYVCVTCSIQYLSKDIQTIWQSCSICSRLVVRILVYPSAITACLHSKNWCVI